MDDRAVCSYTVADTAAVPGHSALIAMLSAPAAAHSLFRCFHTHGLTRTGSPSSGVCSDKPFPSSRWSITPLLTGSQLSLRRSRCDLAGSGVAASIFLFGAFLASPTQTSRPQLTSALGTGAVHSGAAQRFRMRRYSVKCCLKHENNCQVPHSVSCV